MGNRHGIGRSSGLKHADAATPEKLETCERLDMVSRVHALDNFSMRRHLEMESGIRERASIIKAAKSVSLLNDRCDSSHTFNPASGHTVGVR